MAIMCRYYLTIVWLSTMIIFGLGLKCLQCNNNKWYIEGNCREAWSGSLCGAPLCTSKNDVCIAQVKRSVNNDTKLAFFRNCIDKEKCLKKQKRNPNECYDNPIKVSYLYKCTFCCDDADYCNQFIGQNAIMVD
ncbi:uncharacterized protein LOC144346463 [Saccoglossus kowalevskii]